LGTLLARAAGFRCLSTHRTAEEALEQLPRLKPGVVLMDINLPGMSGIEAVRQLKERIPDTLFLMLTVYDDGDRIFESLKAGASGYLLKRTPGNKLLNAIRDLWSGGSPMSSQIARKVVQFFSSMPSSPSELDTLTSREQEVLDHLARGRLYKEIADVLGISLDTVRKHLQSIYNKLHVHSRTEAVVKYLKR
jgi:DNA-binding NarL/FixJ family response regulator